MAGFPMAAPCAVTLDTPDPGQPRALTQKEKRALAATRVAAHSRRDTRQAGRRPRR